LCKLYFCPAWRSLGSISTIYFRVSRGNFIYLFSPIHFWIQSKKVIELKNSNKNLSIKSVFLIVFLAEFGDVSQLSIAAVAAKSIKAHCLCVGSHCVVEYYCNCLVGSHNLKRLVNPALIQKARSMHF